MKVHTTVVQEVELDGDAVRKVFDAELEKLCGGDDAYINSKGELERWEDTGHGSGITTIVDKKPSLLTVTANRLRELIHKERMKRGR